MAVIRPIKMTVPKYPSAPIFLAAAIGPGVGGTSVCVAYKPVASATDMEATATFARLANAFLKLDKITKPESQKTGMDTIKPIIPWQAAVFRTDNPQYDFGHSQCGPGLFQNGSDYCTENDYKSNARHQSAKTAVDILNDLIQRHSGSKAHK